MHDHVPFGLSWPGWILNGPQIDPVGEVGLCVEKNWGCDCTRCSGMACGQTVEKAFVETASL